MISLPYDKKRGRGRVRNAGGSVPAASDGRVRLGEAGDQDQGQDDNLN